MLLGMVLDLAAELQLNGEVSRGRAARLGKCYHGCGQANGMRDLQRNSATLHPARHICQLMCSVRCFICCLLRVGATSAVPAAEGSGPSL
jgi:hypothetical protein